VLTLGLNFVRVVVLGGILLGVLAETDDAPNFSWSEHTDNKKDGVEANFCVGVHKKG